METIALGNGEILDPCSGAGINTIGESPCSTIENNTTIQQMASSLSLPGILANTGSSTSSNELNALGPNHAIRRRSFQDRVTGNNAGINAAGRAANTAATNSSVIGPIIVIPLHI